MGQWGEVGGELGAGPAAKVREVWEGGEAKEMELRGELGAGPAAKVREER